MKLSLADKILASFVIVGWCAVAYVYLAPTHNNVGKATEVQIVSESDEAVEDDGDDAVDGADSDGDDSSTFFIADVISLSPEAVVIEHPNGEYHTYSIPVDAPDYFDEVVVRARDLDDVSTYRIVGLR